MKTPELLNPDRPVIFLTAGSAYAYYAAMTRDELLDVLSRPNEDPVWCPIVDAATADVAAPVEP